MAIGGLLPHLPLLQRRRRMKTLTLTIILLLITVFPASAQDISEYCSDHPDASFCSGDSVKECQGGYTVPEDEDCPLAINQTQLPGCWQDEFGCVGPALDQSYPHDPTWRCEVLGDCESSPVSCEDDGTCDDSCSPPARDDCELPPPPQDTTTTTQEQLPQTGISLNLLLGGLTSLAIGMFLLRRTAH